MKKLFYTNKKPADAQKLRGGYYTPLRLAQFLVDLTLRGGAERILEPSCGDGNFVVALLEHFKQRAEGGKETSSRVVAVEVMEDELEKARKRASRLRKHGARFTWLCGDFFRLYDELRKGEKFDVVLGNPPFIRFQYFDDASREIAFGHLREAGYNPTKLANAWAAFVELSVELLREGGRLAMVVPAELLQVMYAGELRGRLAAKFEHIILVGFKKLVIPEIQQEVLLLLADGKREESGRQSDIHTIDVEDEKGLLELSDLDQAEAHVPVKHSRPGMKWTSLFLKEETFNALDIAEKTPGLTRLGELAEVDVGVVTGRNSFFILTEELRKELGASPYCVPLVGRTSALRSVVFDKGMFEGYLTQHPAWLLDLNGVRQEKLPKKLRDYLASGEAAGVHTGFKCRVRKSWFGVPSIYVPDAFLFRQIHECPLLVLNTSEATSTDTIHRVRFKRGVNRKLLAATFLNSLTIAWAEVCGRSYGGGVLELEPREAEELPLPYQPGTRLDFQKVDRLLRKGDLYGAVDYVDSVTLRGVMRFDEGFVRLLRAAWEELRNRRMNRR